MGFDYIYTRDLIDNAYNISNPLRLDEFGFQIHISKEIESALPNRVFIVICNEHECKVSFETELTEAEWDILDAVVATHKNNA